MSSPAPVTLQILRRPEVEAKLGVSRSTLYAIQGQDPTFPAVVRLSASACGFFEHEVDAWLRARAAKGVNPRTSTNSPLVGARP
ncbi:helix-turn-helix transcriptional regulator [Pseudoxanthomonas daejeonensis]|uniref:helix-turn-helix transcriptional regulator n=1 Tax=Pseudoxanthomonas daejeonensis TaxID=266062 RepID=UPI003CE578E5